MSRLVNRVCVVTGATGIAAATAHRLVAEGAAVFTISVDEDECEALHGELAAAGADHAWAAADLTDEAATGDAFRACIERFATIDGLVAVAGGSGRRFGDGPVHTISHAAWDATLALNLTTSFLSLREGLRHMLEKPQPGGSIVITSSVLAEHPSPERFATHAYATAKGAQLALVRAVSAHYAPKGIRVNAIVPGLTQTPMSVRAQQDEELMAYVAEKQPLAGGAVSARDIGEAAVFLLSNESRYITGQALAVDGGWSVTGGSS